MDRDTLSDRVRINGRITEMKLTVDGRLQWSDGVQRSLTIEKEVLGFVAEGSRIRIRAVLEGKDSICCGGSTGGLVRKDYVFEPLSEDSQRLWCEELRQYIDSLDELNGTKASFGYRGAVALKQQLWKNKQFHRKLGFTTHFTSRSTTIPNEAHISLQSRPKRLLIFVNPFGGRNMAPKIFLDDVKPLLEDANVQFNVQETAHQLHAKEVVKGLDLSKYDGIVCVSGDGILVEVVNGLLGREDWSSSIKMPLGVVPAGTGNGMVKSLLDSVGEPCKASNATLAVIRGHKRLLDVATILQGETRFFSVLMLAWGLVADIDIESEMYRWMGSARIDIYALRRILRLREYNGRVSFVPAPGFENYGVPTTYSEQNARNPSQEQPIKVLQHGYKGPDVDLKNLDWRTINGPFVSVWLHNVPWGSEETMAAPNAKFSDGFLDLIIMRDCPKLGLLQLMTKLNKGGHVKSPYVLYLKVKAFILEPGTRTQDTSKEGIVDSDGEVIARGKGTYQCDQKALMSYDKLQITVDRGLATLFSPV